MPFKQCQHCGKHNPRFLTHCLFCGEPLLEKRQKAGKILAYVQVFVFLCILVLFIWYIVGPALQFSFLSGQDFYRSVTEKSAAESQPAPEYPLNQPADNGVLQITVSSAQDGQYAFQSKKFFIVNANLKNLKAADNIQVTGGNFELIDSGGSGSFPYSVGSQVVYDIRPQESVNIQLTFIIPQDRTGTAIRFTFPSPADATGAKNGILFRI